MASGTIKRPHYESGWKTLTLSSAFTAYNSSFTPQYCRTGYLVNIIGAVKPTSAISYSTTIAKIATLPEGFRPRTQLKQICQGSCDNIWMLSLDTDGTLGFSRYRSGTTQNTASTSAFLPFCITFIEFS